MISSGGKHDLTAVNGKFQGDGGGGDKKEIQRHHCRYNI